MRIGTRHTIGPSDGFTLIESIVYAALLVIVLACAMTVFYQYWDDSRALHRNADAIVRILHTGDQWRTDVRAATGPVTLADVDGVKQLRIPAPAGEIIYSFSEGELRRQAGTNANRILLSNIKSSQMQADPRQNLTAWRWELELKTAKRTTLYRPLFTFESVGGAGIQ
jgi:type II secretory pathway pseudopilin PulG